MSLLHAPGHDALMALSRQRLGLRIALLRFTCCFLFASCSLLTLQAQVLNGNFEESTTSEGHTVPTHWTFDQAGGRYSPKSHSGKHALEISNWYFWAQGWACYGLGEGSWQCAGEPVTGNPTKLTGWYQYLYGDNDGAADSAVCILTVYSGSDTIAYQSMLLGPSKSYKQFSMPIHYRDAERAADTLSIQFWSSQSGRCGRKSGGKCLFLTVDDIEIQSEMKSEK